MEFPLCVKKWLEIAKRRHYTLAHTINTKYVSLEMQMLKYQDMFVANAVDYISTPENQFLIAKEMESWNNGKDN